MTRSRAKAGASPQLSVATLLNEAQRASAAGMIRYSGMLWSLCEEDADATLAQLVWGLKLFMGVPEVRAPPRAQPPNQQSGVEWALARAARRPARP